jgi:hypothetical protein
MPIGIPGCPDCAASTASIASTLSAFAMAKRRGSAAFIFSIVTLFPRTAGVRRLALPRYVWPDMFGQLHPAQIGTAKMLSGGRRVKPGMAGIGRKSAQTPQISRFAPNSPTVILASRGIVGR